MSQQNQKAERISTIRLIHYSTHISVIVTYRQPPVVRGLWNDYINQMFPFKNRKTSEAASLTPISKKGFGGSARRVTHQSKIRLLLCTEVVSSFLKVSIRLGKCRLLI